MAGGKTGMIRGVNYMLMGAIVPLVLGILMSVFPPSEMFTQIRIRMIPGFLSYIWWLEPPVDVKVDIYFFNITNADAFMMGTDSKIKMEEVGPVTYREKLSHKNPVFNDNSTFSYSSKRELFYFPDDNAVDLLNATVIMPNLAALVISSYISNSPFLIKFGLNVMMRKYKTELLKKTTLYNFLWNATDPIVDASSTIAPGLFPVKNIGVMKIIYSKMETNTTVYIAPKYARTEFFKIDKHGGSEYLPQRENNCHEKIVGAFDDIIYHMDIAKNETLRYYSRGLCTTTKTTFVRESTTYGMSAYRFEVPQTYFDRTFPEENDCYKGSPPLPNGMIDCGACYFDTSVTASFPHFMYADELQESIDGMRPEQGKHESYLVVEPSTGVPLEGATRLQMNIAVKDLSGFTPQLQKFSNLNIPLLWTEYKGSGYPWAVIMVMYLFVVVLPVFQVVLSCLLIMLGLYLMYVYLRQKKVCVENKAGDRLTTKESEVFLETENKLSSYLIHYDDT